MKNAHKIFVQLKSLTTFVKPNTADCSSLSYILNAANKAGFLRQFYFSSLAVFGDIQRELASFVYILLNFFLTMPNTGKVYSAGSLYPCVYVRPTKRGNHILSNTSSRQCPEGTVCTVVSSLNPSVLCLL